MMRESPSIHRLADSGHGRLFRQDGEVVDIKPLVYRISSFWERRERRKIQNEITAIVIGHELLSLTHEEATMASVTEFQIIVENFQGGTLKVGWILDGDVYVRFRVVCDGQFVFDYEATTEPIHVHELSETDVKIALGNFASYYRKVLPRAFTNFVPELEKLIERHFTTPLHEGFEL